MKLPIDKIKKDLEEILISSCFLEIACREAIQNCVSAVKRYFNKIKLIKTYTVNCHTYRRDNGIIVKLTVKIISLSGQFKEIKMELWPKGETEIIIKNKKPISSCLK